MLGGLHPAGARADPVLDAARLGRTPSIPAPPTSKAAGCWKSTSMAMFDLEIEQPPLVELDGRLVQEAQKSLARLSVSQRA